MTTETVNAGTIVVAYDGSPDAVHALRWAAEQAEVEKRTLTVAHVVKPLTGFEVSALAAAYTVPDGVAEALDTGGKELLLEAVDKVAVDFPDLPVAITLAHGSPEQVLPRLAEHAACLVLGSRGRGRLASLLLGSVSVSVAGSSTTPVVVVRPHHPGKVRNGVLVGTDCTADSEPTLEFAYRQASLRHLPLTVVYATKEIGVEEHRLALAESVAGMTEKFPDVPVRLRLEHSRPDAWLIEESNVMDLVVVGHHHQPGISDVAGIGSFATAVVERSACPVAVVFTPPAA